jgi:hypothetical protein
MAMDAGNARLIKEEKPGLSAKSLKPNEVKMLFGLAIVGIAALVIYFLLFPMFTNLTTLQQEIDDLTVKKNELTLQAARIGEFEQMYKDAESEYYHFISFFYEPMVPEMIDERITSMLIAHDMSPAALTMTTLQVEGIPPFMAEELRTNPVPAPVDAETDQAAADAGAAGSGATGDTALEDAANQADATAAPPEEVVVDSYVFVYTVDVTAYGDRDNLYTFLAQVGGMTSMKVTAFDFKDKEIIKAANKGEKDTVVPGVINMEIKLYVYVAGVTAGDMAGTGN